MKWQDAKKIPLTELLAQLGYQPSHTSAGGSQVWYASPFRQETKPSFNVNPAKNLWNDLGLGRGGTVIDFVMEYFELTAVSDVLTKLADMGYGDKPPSLFEPKARAVPSLPAAQLPLVKNTAGGITVKKVRPLENAALVQYLESRAIPAAVARPFVQEAYYAVAGKDRTYFGLAFPNVAGGYELRNAYFQGVAGKKAISLILPESPDFFEVLVLEGFMDFLSSLVHWKAPCPTASVIVLNSVAMKDKAIDVIRERGFTDVRLYLDRDDSGRRLTREFQALDGLTVVDGSGVYDRFKDYNAWLQHHMPVHRKKEAPIS